MRAYLTVREVAELVRCEHRTVRRAIQSGDLEASMLGCRWLIRPEAVEAWFQARTNKRPATPTPRKNRQPSSPNTERAGSVGRLKAIEGGKR